MLYALLSTGGIRIYRALFPLMTKGFLRFFSGHCGTMVAFQYIVAWFGAGRFIKTDLTPVVFKCRKRFRLCFAASGVGTLIACNTCSGTGRLLNRYKVPLGVQANQSIGKPCDRAGGKRGKAKQHHKPDTSCFFDHKSDSPLRTSNDPIVFILHTGILPAGQYRQAARKNTIMLTRPERNAGSWYHRNPCQSRQQWADSYR